MGSGIDEDARNHRRLRHHPAAGRRREPIRNRIPLAARLLGQGLATEAAIACRDWAFAHLKTERLISLIRPENLPSRRVAERTGMTLWKEVNWRGLPHCVYSIERAQSSVLRPKHMFVW